MATRKIMSYLGNYTYRRCKDFMGDARIFLDTKGFMKGCARNFWETKGFNEGRCKHAVLRAKQHTWLLW